MCPFCILQVLWTYVAEYNSLNLKAVQVILGVLGVVENTQILDNTSKQFFKIIVIFICILAVFFGHPKQFWENPIDAFIPNNVLQLAENSSTELYNTKLLNLIKAPLSD